MRDLVALVLVALVVTTAGCSGLESSDDREPYGVDEVIDTDSELLSGLTTDGVTDRVALRNAHVDVLEDGSYRRTQRTTHRGATGEVESVSVRNWSVTGETALIVDEIDSSPFDSNESPVVSRQIWVDGIRTAYARVVDESGTVTYRPAPSYVSPDPSPPVSLLSLYDAVDTVTVERENGTEYYRLEGAGPLPSDDNVSFELLLTETGYVDAYDIEVVRTVRGDHLRTEYVGGFEPADDVSLAEPDWVEEAKAEFRSERE
ncbi:hypothetical protein [Halomontanus rarus]|uniref:hypothetical protein n=1 Tax=Halomontanus rarus TaxID=3034020 RepID=UPI001A98B1D8